jgi:hypothetical protein
MLVDALPDEDSPRIRAVIDANLAALGGYRPARYEGPVLAFRATATPSDGDAAWRALAPHICIHEVNADHYSIMRGTAIERILDRLQSSLVGGTHERAAHERANDPMA